MPSQRRVGGARRLAGYVLPLALLAGLLTLAPGAALADTPGGQASAYLAYQQGINICTGWRPAFNESLTRNQPPLTGQSTAITVTNLTTGTQYQMVVYGIDPNSNLVPIPFDVVGDGSGGPAAATASASGTVTLNWPAPTNANVTAFQVFQKGPADIGFVPGTPQAPAQLAPPSTSATITGLTPGARYSFWMRAVDNTATPSPMAFSVAGGGNGGPATVTAATTGTLTLTWSPTPNINSYAVFQRSSTDLNFVQSQGRSPAKVTGTFPVLGLFNPTANPLNVALAATPNGQSTTTVSQPGGTTTQIVTVPAGGFVFTAGLPQSLVPPSLTSLSPASIPLPDVFNGTITATGCPRDLFAVVESATLNVDELLNQFSASFSASIPPPPSCQFWSPLFTSDQNGWTSTLAIHNEANAPLTIKVEARPLSGGLTSPLTTRNFDLAASGFRQISAADLGLPSGFAGSLTALAVLTPNTPIQACEISGVVYHDAPLANRISLETTPFTGTAPGNVVVPLAFNNYNGWNSRVVVRNTDPQADTSVEVRFQAQDGTRVVQVVIVPADSAIELNLAALGAPQGPLTVELRVPPGVLNARPIVAAAYHYGPNGAADAANGSSSGARKNYLPLLFRHYNNYDSGVQVVNAGTGSVTPRITFTDRDTGASVVITAEAPIAEAQAKTWYLPAISSLQDGHVYSALVEVDPSDGDVAIGLANHVNYSTGTAMLYAAAAAPDSTPSALRVRGLTAPIVFDNANGLNSGIQIQNLETTAQSASLRFLNNNGTQLTTMTVQLPANGATTIYLPSVATLPGGFVGSVEIRASGSAAATVNSVRYANGAGQTGLGA